MFEAMLKGEMNHHLGYENNDHGSKTTANRRNGFVPKRKKDVSEIEGKVLALYARGMSQRDIADTIEDIYGFEISHQTISEITDCVLDELSDWQNRPLKKMYTFLFVDCMYVTIRKEYESKNYAVYTILGYGYRRKKDILGLHSAFDPKFNQIYSKQGLQKIHSIAEKGIWSSKSCSLPKSL